MVHTVTINGKMIWLYIQSILNYSPDFQSIESSDGFICFFKLSEPNPVILGELFRDSEGRPQKFISVEQAIEYAIKYLSEKIE